MEIPSLRPETRYGMPSTDHCLMNRGFIVGYSYLFRQPAWTLQLIDADSSTDNVDRRDVFRPDQRIPEQFRTELSDYKNSGYDRGHMVSSADARESKVANSETFLLSNMTMQHPDLNRGKWKDLEQAIRDLAARQEILEVYVVSGILFDLTEPFEFVGTGSGFQLVVPHWYFKSVLAEDVRGKLRLWTFTLPNRKCEMELPFYLTETVTVESWAGLELWNRLPGEKFAKLKTKNIKMW